MVKAQYNHLYHHNRRDTEAIYLNHSRNNIVSVKTQAGCPMTPEGPRQEDNCHLLQYRMEPSHHHNRDHENTKNNHSHRTRTEENGQDLHHRRLNSRLIDMEAADEKTMSVASGCSCCISGLSKRELRVMKQRCVNTTASTAT